MDEPRRRLVVRGTLDGQPIGSVTADEHRRDLVRAGIGDGSYGFRLELERSLGPGEHVISISVEPDGGELPLAEDWIVLDEREERAPGVTLTTGAGTATAPPWPETVTEQAPPHDAPPRPPPPAVGSRHLTVFGEAGWLFDCSEPGFDRIRGTAHPTHAELDQLVAHAEQLHDEARSAGAVSLVACVPDKLHVYREHLPATLAVDPRARVTALLIARLRDSDTPTPLDLLPPLLDARAHGRLFPRTGSRLTWVGAFFAARAIAKAVSARFETVSPLPADGLDLGPLAQLSDTLTRNEHVAWINDGFVQIGARPPAEEELEPTLGDRTALVARRASSDGVERWERLERPELPSALVVTDGSGARIARLLAESFSRCAIVEADRVTGNLVRSHWPDALIQITSDRTLSVVRTASG
jgi:hypothetical protein